MPKIIACVEDPVAIGKIHKHLNEKAVSVNIVRPPPGKALPQSSCLSILESFLLLLVARVAPAHPCARDIRASLHSKSGGAGCGLKIPIIQKQLKKRCGNGQIA